MGKKNNLVRNASFLMIAAIMSQDHRHHVKSPHILHCLGNMEMFLYQPCPECLYDPFDDRIFQYSQAVSS